MQPSVYYYFLYQLFFTFLLLFSCGLVFIYLFCLKHFDDFFVDYNILSFVGFVSCASIRLSHMEKYIVNTSTYTLTYLWMFNFFLTNLNYMVDDTISQKQRECLNLHSKRSLHMNLKKMV